MKILLLCAHLFAAAGVQSQPARPPFCPASPELQGGLGFTSLSYLLNRAAWSALPGSGMKLKDGITVVGLDDPLQAIVVFNGWHLPAVAGEDDIRLVDLRKHVLRRSLTFASAWPEYTAPGYIVIVQKRDREWVLIANLSGQYLVEDRSGIGFVHDR